MSGTLFRLGQVVATPEVLEEFKASGDDPLAYLIRHWCGDWGEVNDEDSTANDLALIRGVRLLSAYTMSNGTRFWIIAEADRSCTTILLPSEY